MWQRLLPLAMLAGCSAESSPGAVNGTIRGNRYPVAASISAILASPSSSAPSVAMVVLSSSTDVCLPPDAQIQHPGETTIVILLRDGDAAASAPGVFTAFDPTRNTTPPAKSAILYTSVLNATCANIATDQTAAVSGSVTLTAVGGGRFEGRFDVVLDSADHITGSFSPMACELLPAELESDTPPTCKP